MSVIVKPGGLDQLGRVLPLNLSRLPRTQQSLSKQSLGSTPGPDKTTA